MDNWYKQAKWFLKNGYLPKVESGYTMAGAFKRFIVFKGKTRQELNFFYSHGHTSYSFTGHLQDWCPRYNWIEKL